MICSLVYYAVVALLLGSMHSLWPVDAANSKESNRLQDLQAVQHLHPLLNGSSVFFWRPQKVGSSTMLSVLMSYGFRYNFLPKRKSSSNAYCRLFAKCAIINSIYPLNITQSYLENYITQRIPGTPMRNQQLTQKDLDAERLSNTVRFKISLSHEVCNLNAQVIEKTMSCTFSKGKKTNNSTVRELFMLRDPLSRSISVYYFWGELYKMKHGMKRMQAVVSHGDPIGLDTAVDTDRQSRKEKKKRKQRQEQEESANRALAELKLGQSDFSDPVIVHGQRFQYHGKESTAPDVAIAMRYAKHDIYRPGMPGPSNTWSAFADNLVDALAAVQSDRMCTIVLERLHESLVVAAHYLGWSLADVVVVKHRKALSSHPKHTEWPQQAVELLRKQLNTPEVGEYAMYNASVAKLDQRIAALTKAGVDVPAEVTKLQQLQKRVSEVSVA
jgi:hypothetical protein